MLTKIVMLRIMADFKNGSNKQSIDDKALLNLTLKSLMAWEGNALEVLQSYVYEKIHTIKDVKECEKWHRLYDLLTCELPEDEEENTKDMTKLPSGAPWPSDEELLASKVLDFDSRPLEDLYQLLLYAEHKAENKEWEDLMMVIHQACLGWY